MEVKMDVGFFFFYYRKMDMAVLSVYDSPKM